MDKNMKEKIMEKIMEKKILGVINTNEERREENGLAYFKGYE